MSLVTGRDARESAGRCGGCVLRVWACERKVYDGPLTGPRGAAVFSGCLNAGGWGPMRVLLRMWAYVCHEPSVSTDQVQESWQSRLRHFCPPLSGDTYLPAREPSRKKYRVFAVVFHFVATGGGRVTPSLSRVTCVSPLLYLVYGAACHDAPRDANAPIIFRIIQRKWRGFACKTSVPCGFARDLVWMAVVEV